MNERTEELLVKGVGTLAALAAAWLVQRALAAVWKAVAGHEMPGEDASDEAVGEVVAAAVVTGALGAVVRVLATRSGKRAAQRVLARR